MPIIRRELDFERRQFTQIPNSWLRDENLSLKAKGLLAQLLSHQVGWSMTIGTLAKTNRCGRDMITSAIQELEIFGYLKRMQQKDDKGRFGEMLWFTTSPDDPVTGFPTSDSPTPDNPTLKKTKEKKTKEKNTNLDVFDQFWSLYPRKAGKASARKAFSQLDPDQITDVMVGVERLRNDPNLPPAQYIPHPATWLNREGWEDDPYPKREQKPGEKAAEGPIPRAWVKSLHDEDDHTFCRPGEFGH